MAAIPPSGKTLPAPFAAAYLHVIVDLLGPNGVDAVLRLAGLETWIGRPPAVPDSTPADFADISSLLGALDETLGSRGGVGRAAAAAAGMPPEAETTIEETACRAHGSSTCDFSIRWEAAA